MRAALRLVWGLGVRHLTAHRARLGLSTVGIAAGVTLAVAVGALGSSIDASLRAAADAAASRANLEVRPRTDAGLPPEVLSRVRRTEGVRAAGAAVESFTDLRHAGVTERTLVLGVDAGLLELSPQAVDTEGLGEVADPFGLFLPAPVARDLGVSPGDGIEVATPRGWREVTVGAVFGEDAGRSRVVAGLIGTVGDLFGREGRADVIYLEADDPDRVLPRVREAVGDVGRVGDRALLTDEVGDLLSATTTSLQVATIVALFVGAFLVYNTMAMAAVERVSETALMRAVGARRRQVFGLFLSEGAVLGVVGSGLGLAGGVMLAQVLLVRQGGTLEEIFPIEITRLAFDPVQLAAAGAAGVAASVLAAYLPARRIARSDPAPALGPAGALEDPTARPLRATTAAGVAACAVGVALAAAGMAIGEQHLGIALAGFTVFLAGVALCVRWIVPALAGLAYGPVLRRSSRASGHLRLAAGEVLRSPGRTAFTVGAMFLALALVVGFSITQSSFARTFQLHFEEVLRADLYVRSATWQPFGADVPMDESLADELREVPGVEIAYPFRMMTASVDGRTTLLQAFDYEEYAALPGLSPQWRREAREQAGLIAREGTVLVTPSFLRTLGYEIGDEVDLPTPTGLETMTIAGTVEDPAAVNPQVFLHYPEFAELWGERGADTFPVGLSPDADPEAVRAEITERFGSSLGIEVDTRSEFVERVQGLVSSVLDLIVSVQLVAVVVAGLGLANTLLISTLERRRELGVLRAVGMLRRQVRRMVAVEALLVAALGIVLAWGLGTIIGIGMQIVTELQLGMPLHRVFPPSGYLAAAALGLTVAAAAALYPAHRAARVDVVDALHYE